MSTKLPSREKLKPNTEWAKLQLFDRKGWRRVRFGDVVENSNESERDPEAAGVERFIGLEHLEPGSLHVKSWGNVADGTTFTRRCKRGQVLFGKRRAYQRKVAVAEFDAVVSGDIYVLAPKNDKLLPELHLPVGALLSTCRRHVRRLAIPANELEQPRFVRVRPPAARPAAPHRGNPLGSG
jgi:hypothetical protein